LAIITTIAHVQLVVKLTLASWHGVRAAVLLVLLVCISVYVDFDLSVYYKTAWSCLLLWNIQSFTPIL